MNQYKNIHLLKRIWYIKKHSKIEMFEIYAYQFHDLGNIPKSPKSIKNAQLS